MLLTERTTFCLSNVTLVVSGWSLEKTLCKSDGRLGCSDFGAKSKREDPLLMPLSPLNHTLIVNIQLIIVIYY